MSLIIGLTLMVVGGIGIPSIWTLSMSDEELLAVGLKNRRGEYAEGQFCIGLAGFALCVTGAVLVALTLGWWVLLLYFVAGFTGTVVSGLLGLFKAIRLEKSMEATAPATLPCTSILLP